MPPPKAGQCDSRDTPANRVSGAVSTGLPGEGPGDVLPRPQAERQPQRTLTSGPYIGPFANCVNSRKRRVTSGSSLRSKVRIVREQCRSSHNRSASGPIRFPLYAIAFMKDTRGR